jgi:hypothetical protein
MIYHWLVGAGETNELSSYDEATKLAITTYTSRNSLTKFDSINGIITMSSENLQD